ncbi:hypothetical protein KVT40_006404 [Elsinoe batatas]|uniref:Rpb7-binding protein seb1 n=1 Tax=Elsinoe batatas TaxID=2601811 RepID=A0A8K0L585_9PEZI|nr:hypothetical protein KVT40_006404 [Elsinoe batatas]
MSQVDQLDPLLQSLQSLKPPGASKSKITAITQICVENIHLDSTIAQKIYSNFKRTPPTHKLGILFVLDSVTRQWIEKARASGQELGLGSAPVGTYASGVQRMTELLPSLVDETVRTAPPDQKPKIQNLVEIWERGATFPEKMIADFKQKLQGLVAYVPSRTPPGSPPPQLLHYLGLRPAPTQPPPVVQPAAPVPAQVSSTDTAGLLRALAGLVMPAQHSPAPVPQPPQPNPQDLSALLAGFAQPPAPPVIPQPPPPSQYQQYTYPPQPVQSPSFPPQLASLYPPAAPVPPPQQAPQQPDLATTIANLVPPHILADPEKVAQIAQLFDGLLKNGIPQEQWGPVIAALYPQANQVPAPAPVQSWQPPAQNGRAGFEPPTGSRKRDRSRSPDARQRPGSNQRANPAYGGYDVSANMTEPQQDFSSNGAGRGKNRYRQRSPPSKEKWVSFDPALLPNHIKVLSRTLFVGGCSAREAELRGIFERFGAVQTCIVNADKRHAFVKMCTRQGAVAAKQGMDELQRSQPNTISKARQTKWGVGFGPRECCDYSNGESIIPISSLTEADLKWALTAEYGGTGGQEVQPGLVMEEPDIEIGTGVSSKAMSKRVGPETGGKHEGGDGHNKGRHRGSKKFRKGGGADAAMGAGSYGASHQERFNSPRPQEQVAYAPPPAVPSFGFQFALPGSGPPY